VAKNERSAAAGGKRKLKPAEQSFSVTSDPMLDSIKSVIFSSYPEAEIFVLDNPRDFAGGMLFVTNVPEQFKREFHKNTDFVTVALDKSGNGSEFIVVPIAQQDPMA